MSYHQLIETRQQQADRLLARDQAFRAALRADERTPSSRQPRHGRAQ